MQAQKVLRIFLASPGDLGAERKLFREAVDGLNRSACRHLGVQIELYGWEDTLPGYGRPQELINPEVDKCDLFVGLLWQRWGTPTGVASSGFEEEVSRAIKRKEETSSPDIWVLLKKVPRSLLNDPGDHLKRVLQFRQRVSGTLLFKEFKNQQDFVPLVYQMLSSYVVDLSTTKHDFDLPVGPSLASSPALAGQLEVPEGLVQAVQSVQGFLTGRSTPMEPVHVARLQLWAAALSKNYGTEDQPGTHVINFIYQFRKDIELTKMEAQYLLPAVFSDLTETRPGWYWFQHVLPENLLDVPMNMLSDYNQSFVRGYLELARTMQRLPPPPAVVAILDLRDSYLRAGMLDLLYSYAGRPLLTELVEVLDPMEHARLLTTVAARESSDDALHRIIASPELVSDNALATIQGSSNDISNDTLARGLDHANEQIQQFCVGELVRRNKLPITTARQLLNHVPSKVKLTLVALLIEEGAINLQEIDEVFHDAFDERRQALLQCYRRTPTVDLKLKNFYLQQTDLIFRALIERNEPASVRLVRVGLLEDFKGFRDSSLRELQEQLPSELYQEFITTMQPYHSGITHSLIMESLAGLLTLADPADFVIARVLIDHPNILVRQRASELLVATASLQNRDELVSLALTMTGTERDNIAKAALRCSTEYEGPISRFIDSDQSPLVLLALAAASKLGNIVPEATVNRLLHDSNSTVRLATLSYLGTVKPWSDLVDILERYFDGFRYYNVVVWLDRLLYAPGSLRDQFREKLLSHLPLI